MVSGKVVAAIVIVAIVAFAAGFVAQPFISPPTRELKPVLIRLDYLIGGKHVGFFVALDKGYYRDMGIDATIGRGFGSGDTCKAVDAGKADIGMADTGTLIKMRAQGLRVKEIGMIYGRSPMTIDSFVEKNIKTPKDLEGKSLAVSPGTSPYAMMDALFKLNNVDKTKIKFIEMSPGLTVPAVLEGKADARFGYLASDADILEITARRQGKQIRHIEWADFGLDIYTNGLIARDDMIKNNPDLVKAVVKATMMGYKYAIEHPEEALQILLKYNPQLDEEITRVQANSILKSIQSPEALANGLGYHDPEKMKKTVDLINRLFNLSVNVDDVYTNQFIEKL